MGANALHADVWRQLITEHMWPATGLRLLQTCRRMFTLRLMKSPIEDREYLIKRHVYRRHFIQEIWSCRGLAARVHTTHDEFDRLRRNYDCCPQCGVIKWKTTASHSCLKWVDLHGVDGIWIDKRSEYVFAISCPYKCPQDVNDTFQEPLYFKQWELRKMWHHMETCHGKSRKEK